MSAACSWGLPSATAGSMATPAAGGGGVGVGGPGGGGADAEAGNDFVEDEDDAATTGLVAQEGEEVGVDGDGAGVGAGGLDDDGGDVGVVGEDARQLVASVLGGDDLLAGEGA